MPSDEVNGVCPANDALDFCLQAADVEPQRFDRPIPRWHARFVLEAVGFTADESALALSAASISWREDAPSSYRSNPGQIVV